MFLLRRPSPALLERVLAEEGERAVSYPSPGMTRSRGAPGYPANRLRLAVGEGEEGFVRAVAALRGWAMYDLPWTELYPPSPPVQSGAAFAAVVRHLGFWSINPCRIVWVEDEDGLRGRRAFSFAIGTLPRHSESGEERFRVEWDPSDDAVRFELLAYARPSDLLARLGSPYVRHLQRRFAREAAAAVRRRVAAGPNAAP